MNHEIYSAALPLLEIVNSDPLLRAQTSDYGDWYDNLLEHVCDFEAENLETVSYTHLTLPTKA